MKGLHRFVSALSIALLILAAGCDDDSVSGTQGDGPADEPDPPEAVYITDRTGKAWEISHAVNEYGMLPENFNYGLGPNAIRPINDPEMLEKGEAGYPVDDLRLGVLGVSMNGDSRAYPLHILSSHEVVNDIVGEVPIAAVF